MTLLASDICAALPLVIHVSKGDDLPKQNLVVLPGEAGAPNWAHKADEQLLTIAQNLCPCYSH